MCILPGITTLIQYLATFKKLKYPLQCPKCDSCRLVGHGVYYRKADRKSGALNPIPIQRFFCRNCHVTCSALPECIPPRRWYLWDIQQEALLLYSEGQSLRAITDQLSGPAVDTVARWVKRFQNQFSLHASVIRVLRPALACNPGFKAFWQACFKEFSLAVLMRLCHVAHVDVP